MIISHPFPPLYDSGSRILILGSFPSVKSREQMFFYGHPQNRFWRLTSLLLGCETPQTVEQKAIFLHSSHIALWDVIASCDVTGSADSSIRGVVPNDLSPIFAAANIRAVFVNGATAKKYYDRFQLPALGREAICLPSTSPANAAYSLDRLATEWQVITKYL